MGESGRNEKPSWGQEGWEYAMMDQQGQRDR